LKDKIEEEFLMKRINGFGLICLIFFVFLFSAAPTYRNDGANNLLVGGILFTPGKSVQTGKYVNSDELIFLSHSPAVDPWPTEALWDAPISLTPITLTQRYESASVYNGSGNTLTIYFNNDNSTSKSIKLPDSNWWVINNSNHLVGTIHLSGSGGGNVLVQEY
jgi:hypothetical protein